MVARLSRILCVLLVFGLLGACATVPSDYPREASYAIRDTADTDIGRFAASWSAQNDGLSGFYPLVEGNDAFGVRLRLIEAAERSIDAQYFLMKSDAAGDIFAVSLLRAADRGVRVRILLDDVFTTVGDRMLAMLDQHRMIEVRLFNPVSRRGFYFGNYLVDFERSNRRMHNKSFTVDNKISVVGGRNIAEEYFELKHDAEFLDFDVLVAGTAASEVNDTFDLFWNDTRSIPITAVDEGYTDGEYREWRAMLEAAFEQDNRERYRNATESKFVRALFDETNALFAAPHKVITDAPGKLATVVNADEQLLVNYLAEVAAAAQTEVLVITPYFVPLQSGIEYWRGLTSRGVRVIVLTNSLASNNHTAVHSAYARYRKALIEAGVELYEARVNAVANKAAAEGEQPEMLTLHTKAVAIDRRTLFVGSLNLDPRSIELNSEMGILIDSEAMVGPLVNEAMDDLPEFAYRLHLDETGELRWHGVVDGDPVVEKREPQTSVFKRFKAWFLRIVPESQL